MVKTTGRSDKDILAVSKFTADNTFLPGFQCPSKWIGIEQKWEFQGIWREIELHSMLILLQINQQKKSQLQKYMKIKYVRLDDCWKLTPPRSSLFEGLFDGYFQLIIHPLGSEEAI